MSKVTTQVTVPFGMDAGGELGNASISIERDEHFYNNVDGRNSRSIFFRLYCGNLVCKLYTTAGSIQVTNPKIVIQETKTEAQVLIKQDTISLSGPILAATVLDVTIVPDLCSASEPTVPGWEPRLPAWNDIEDVTWMWDAEENVLRASRPITGIVRFTYTTSYTIIKYQPRLINPATGEDLTDSPESNMLVQTLFSAGFIIQYGTIFAVEPKTCTIVSHMVESTKIDTEESSCEIGYAYSKYLITPNGPWERPLDWPNSTWAGQCEQRSLDPGDSYVEVERRHFSVILREYSSSLGIDPHTVKYYCPDYQLPDGTTIYCKIEAPQKMWLVQAYNFIGLAGIQDQVVSAVRSYIGNYPIVFE